MRSRARILLVEDNDISRLVLTQLLRRLGCEVTAGANGREAVDAFAANTFDLVLMDCLLPIMDGVEAAQVMRASEPPGRRTPIVALTASAMEEDRQRCLAAGMDDFLSKPAPIEQLAEVIDRWVAATPDDEG